MALEVLILQQPYPVNFSGNAINYTFVCTPYGFIERSQDIRIQVRIEAEVSFGSGVFKEVKSQIVFPDPTGSVQIDIKSIADAYLKWYTPRPTLFSAVRAHTQSGKFRLVIVALKDGILITDPVTSDVIDVIKGGMAYEQFHYSDFFSNVIAVQHQPLNFFTGKELVAKTDKMFLTWLYPYDTEEIQIIRMVATLANGTIVTQDSEITVASKKWAVYMCPLGFNDVAALMPTDPYNEPVKYTVSIVTETGVVVVAPVTFFIDYRNFYDSTLLLYTNSIGGINTARILGEIDSMAEYAEDKAQQITPPSGIANAILVADTIAAEIQEIEKFLGHTDFLPKDQVNRHRDLLLSRNKYEYKDGKLIPISVIKKSVKFYTNTDRLTGMSFEWQHAFSNAFYTPAGTIPANETCPGMQKLEVRQINKHTLHVMWAIPMPYDTLELQIDNGTPADLQTIYLNGNTGSVQLEFTNPAVYPDTADIIVKGRVVCNQDADPMDTGAFTTVTIPVYANTLPVANDDLYSIPAGYNTAQVLTGSVMENDYDADDDPLEVIADAGATEEGGTFIIDAAGIITYEPPSSSFNGTDFFEYKVREIATPAMVSDPAVVRINVGNVALGNAVFAKIVEKNHTQTDNPFFHISTGSFYLSFFADPTATIPKDVTALALVFNVRFKKSKYTGGAWVVESDVTQNITGIGIEMHLFTGTFLSEVFLIGTGHQISGHKLEISILAGTGYIPI